jgi:outer membrane protein assembly factor BamB
MPDWSPSRREFLGVAGVGGSSAVGLPVASWGNVTDAVPDHPFVPTADERWSLDLGDDDAYLTGPTDGTLFARTPGVVHGIQTDGTESWQLVVESDRPGLQVGRLSPYRSLERILYVHDEKRVYALDPADGSVRWRYEDAWRPSVATTIPGLVVAYDDERLGRDDALVGLSADDGSESWRLALDGGLWLSSHFDGETLYVGTDEGMIYAVDPRDGDVRWRTEPLDGEADSGDDPSPLVVTDSTDHVVFAWRSKVGSLLALDAADGSVRWRFDADSDGHDLPGTIRDGVLYLRQGSSLLALSTANGSERWRIDAENFFTWPRVVGETVYVGNEEGVYALSAADGSERWWSSAANFPTGVTERTLVATDREYSVFGLDRADGSVRWRYDPEAKLSAPPHAHEGTTYLATKSGGAVALSPPGSTPVLDALRTAVSPTGLAVGGLLGGALAVGAYRRRTRADDATDSPDEPTVFEDFELADTVAETDHVEVYDARTPDGSRVALKRLAPGEIPRANFTEAVETWADLDVPGVLDVRAWGLDPAPWVATEYATGGNLGAKAEDLTVEERARVVAEVAETVHRAHREDVTHGRLVPGNVLFGQAGVRVGDWRLAAELRDPPDELLPPESEPASNATDTYQLAAMTDEFLSDDQRSGELERVFSRALAADPADRYDSALKFADALRWAVRE